MKFIIYAGKLAELTSPGIAELIWPALDGHLSPLDLAWAEARLLHENAVESIEVKPASLDLIDAKSSCKIWTVL